MSESYTDTIAYFTGLAAQGRFGRLRRGLEKEGLRIDRAGRISSVPHPHALGSKLTHPYITTDYSEALLEFITPVCILPGHSRRLLADLHR